MFASNVIHINRRGLGVLMTLSLLLMPLLSASNASVRAAPAYTEVGGPIISDTTWTKAQSPYIVVANVEVWQGVTLTIEPGVVVKFNKDKLLQVNGTLIARGSADRTIVFTSNQPSPQKGDWGNIMFTDSSTDATFDGAGNYTGGSVLEYCVVEHGRNEEIGGAIQTDRASPLIDHCTVRNNNIGIWAVSANESPIVIRNNTVSCNSTWRGGGGIKVWNGTVTRNLVSANSATGYYVRGGGIHAYGSMVTENIVSGNSATGGRGSGGGIYAEDSTVTGNIVSGNSASDSYGDSDGRGGGIYAKDSTITSNTVRGNSAAFSYDCWRGDLGGGIHASHSTVMSNTVSGNSVTCGDVSYSGGGIYASYSPVTGNIVSTNSGGGIRAESSPVKRNTVSGNLANYGGGIYASDSPVMDNIVSGNTASGEGGGIDAFGNSPVTGNIVIGNSAGGDGGGIDGGTMVISNTVIANTTVAGQGSGVSGGGWDGFLYNTVVGNTTVSPTTITGGVAIYGGTPNFHYNNIYGNSNYDVVVLSSKDISGTNNYWGTVATVDILAHVYDWYDDSARGRLLYIPYLQDPDPNAPVPPPRNLRATFSGTSATMTWDAIPSTTTGYGYKVYYDTDASGPPYNGTGAAQGNSPVDVSNATHFTLSGLGGHSHVAVTAYDTQGRESWYSNEGSSPSRVYLPTVLKR